MSFRNEIDNIDKLNKQELAELVRRFDDGDFEYAAALARAVARERFQGRVFIRGLIEFTNYCKNNCYYCGLRRDNRNVSRYRLGKEEILECCRRGYPQGFRTFVLQGGEDPFFTDGKICEIVEAVKGEFPDCAVTLSLGEKPRKSYRMFRDAGADRYLLRHETAGKCHYEKLHPAEMSFENRLRCLADLKETGFQTGCGFMVGSPFQTPETIAEDFIFMRELQPEMIGIGPFLPQADTPFAEYTAGSVRLTLFLISLLRLHFPSALIPATTALGSAGKGSRLAGMNCGANVVMPNLTPASFREKYRIYDNKSADSLENVRQELAGGGYEIVTDRGDFRK